MEQGPATGLDDLPNPVLAQVLKHLPLPGILVAQLVCTRMRDAAHEALGTCTVLEPSGRLTAQAMVWWGTFKAAPLMLNTLRVNGAATAAGERRRHIILTLFHG